MIRYAYLEYLELLESVRGSKTIGGWCTQSMKLLELVEIHLESSEFIEIIWNLSEFDGNHLEPIRGENHLELVLEVYKQLRSRTSRQKQMRTLRILRDSNKLKFLKQLWFSIFS